LKFVLSVILSFILTLILILSFILSYKIGRFMMIISNSIYLLVIH